MSFVHYRCDCCTNVFTAPMSGPSGTPCPQCQRMAVPVTSMGFSSYTSAPTFATSHYAYPNMHAPPPPQQPGYSSPGFHPGPHDHHSHQQQHHHHPHYQQHQPPSQQHQQHHYDLSQPSSQRSSMSSPYVAPSPRMPIRPSATPPSNVRTRIPVHVAPTNDERRCPICCKAYNRRADLDRHLRTVHRGHQFEDGRRIPDEDHYWCDEPGCDRGEGGDKGSFNRRDHLLEHIRNVHGRGNPRRRAGGERGGGTA